MTITRPQCAVIYCRVSSTKQVREGNGLSSQETRCREYAGFKKYEIAGVFGDDITGKLMRRSGIESMLAFLRQHRKERPIVLIDDISRLARDRQVYYDLRDAITLAGGVLESPSIRFGEDADSQFFEGLMVNVAQHQRQKNAEQTKNRMRARAMNGYWVFRAPIGYRFERVAGHGKLLVRDEPLASIVAEALTGYASGRFETLVEVKRFLESQAAWPKDSHGEVHPERVTEIVSRPVYAGHITLPEWGLNLVPAKHEQLVSLATWQAVQNRRNGTAKAPTRKDIRDDFPLRGFVTCGHCGEAYTACWSKGRSALYAYYLCDTKGCVAYRKSVRRDVIEGEFESLLRSLKPSEGLFNLAFAMFRDLWDAKLAGARTQGATLEKDVRAIERKIEQLLDRIVEAEGASLIAAYEKRIRDLETEKALMREKIASCGKPIASFGETYRTAFDFLANPCRLWHSPRLEDRRAVLKLVFAERLPYVRNEGYRTAKISMPFKLLGSMETDKKLMVRPRGLEPPPLAGLAPQASASTNSAMAARAAGPSERAGISCGRRSR